MFFSHLRQPFLIGSSTWPLRIKGLRLSVWQLTQLSTKWKETGWKEENKEETGNATTYIENVLDSSKSWKLESEDSRISKFQKRYQGGGKITKSWGICILISWDSMISVIAEAKLFLSKWDRNSKFQKQNRLKKIWDNII